MRQFVRKTLWLPCMLLIAGCASGGGAADGGRMGYQRDLGRLLQPTLDEARLKVWQKHNWHLQREELEFQNIYWETQWRPFNVDTGNAVGPTEARGRIVIRGRRVGGELDGGSVYRVTMVGQYQVRGGVTDDWRPAPLPDDAEDVFDQVFSDLSLELRTGVRR